MGRLGVFALAPAYSMRPALDFNNIVPIFMLACVMVVKGVTVVQRTSVAGPFWMFQRPLFRQLDSCTGRWLNPVIVPGSALCQGCSFGTPELCHTLQRAGQQKGEVVLKHQNTHTQAQKFNTCRRLGFQRLSEMQKYKEVDTVFVKMLNWTRPRPLWSLMNLRAIYQSSHSLIPFTYFLCLS